MKLQTRQNVVCLSNRCCHPNSTVKKIKSRLSNLAKKKMETMLKEDNEAKIIPLDEMFAAYCQMDPTSDAMGVHLLPLSQSDAWLTSAKILDMRSVTTTDTGLCFFKFRKRAVSFDDYMIYLSDLAKTKKLNIQDMKLKMQKCQKPIHPRDMTTKIK